MPFFYILCHFLILYVIFICSMPSSFQTISLFYTTFFYFMWMFYISCQIFIFCHFRIFYSIFSMLCHFLIFYVIFLHFMPFLNVLCQISINFIQFSYILCQHVKFWIISCSIFLPCHFFISYWINLYFLSFFIFHVIYLYFRTFVMPFFIFYASSQNFILFRSLYFMPFLLILCQFFRIWCNLLLCHFLILYRII